MYVYVFGMSLNSAPLPLKRSQIYIFLIVVLISVICRRVYVNKPMSQGASSYIAQPRHISVPKTPALSKAMSSECIAKSKKNN